MTTRVCGVGFDSRPFFAAVVQLLEGVVEVGSGIPELTFNFFRNFGFREIRFLIFRLGADRLLVAVAFPDDVSGDDDDVRMSAKNPIDS